MSESEGQTSAGVGSHYFALPEGTMLHEFRIEEVLGHGGFGITYRATDTVLQEAVAIKEYFPNELAGRVSSATVRAKSPADLSDYEVGLESFIEEARLIARFRHPNIVHVRRFFVMHGTGYIVLDYEHGDTLSRRLQDGVLPERELRHMLMGLLEGLETIHDQAILHRDLKPSNVIIREDNSPVLIDFGAARDFRERHSRSVTAIAAPGYSPPEQYGVGGQQGPWTDLYALGAIAYRCVTGQAPINSLRRLRADPIVPATKAAAGDYTVGLLRTIDWMLRVNEVDRPASVASVRQALTTAGPRRRSALIVSLISALVAVSLGAVVAANFTTLSGVACDRANLCTPAESAKREQIAIAIKQKADAEADALRRTEEEVRKKLAQVEAKRRAEEAQAKARADQQKAAEVAEAARKAEEAARQAAEAEAKRKADDDAAVALDPKVAEATETSLRMSTLDRRRVQVALTSLGFDTKGSDGMFGPRSRDMIQSWQRERNQPPTGFLTGPQQQNLFDEAAAALASFDESLKRTIAPPRSPPASVVPTQTQPKDVAPVSPPTIESTRPLSSRARDALGKAFTGDTGK